MGDTLRLQMEGKLSVQLNGILSKSWHSRYCVFYIKSSGSSPQIHVFEKEDNKKEKDKKIFHLDEIKTFQCHKDKEYGFDLITKTDKFCFAAENKSDFKLWVYTLKQELRVTFDGVIDEDDCDIHIYDEPAAPTFSVTVEDNDAAKRCNLRGVYYLVVNLHNLALVDRNTMKAIYQWPFLYIRRFGKTRSNFQFEAGRRCSSGEGDFSFLTEQGFEIFEAFSRTTSSHPATDPGIK